MMSCLDIYKQARKYTHFFENGKREFLPHQTVEKRVGF